MPLYEYLCKKCGHRFEKILKFSDKPIKKCPECGGVVEQVISAPAVQFKGSGWYVTDYAKKSNTSGSSSNSGESSSKDSKESKDSKDSKKEDKKQSDSSAKDSSRESSSRKSEKSSK